MPQPLIMWQMTALTCLFKAATRYEGGNRVEVGDIAFERQARGHPDHVRLADPFHKKTGPAFLL